MSVIAHRIQPKPKDLGDGFIVRRALPAIEARHVGPFIFLDEMGPVTIKPGGGLDVRPHPHIGLATVTYLFAGAIEHRDSLGTLQVIRPGDVNWMTAGRGIVHSERSPQPRDGGLMHGIQFWVALPKEQEETDPAFHHYPAATIPKIVADGAAVTVLVGTFDGRTSPVIPASPTLYLDLALSDGGSVVISADTPERAVFVVEGSLLANGEAIEAGELAVLTQGEAARLCANTACRAIMFGGAPLDGPRKLVWNFVSSRPERIDQAKADWRAQAMGQVPGETEFIPFPDV